MLGLVVKIYIMVFNEITHNTLITGEVHILPLFNYFVYSKFLFIATHCGMNLRFLQGYIAGN